MDVTIKEISPETVNALQALAQENGKSLEEYARAVLERETQNNLDEKESANADKIKAFDEWMNDLDPNTPNLTDEQISRESIYEEQILRQL
ncbi:MAG: FitA-like ribbon-helix-helix domain-containing protein [Pyrinomonadaceae bacterium]